MKKHVAGLLSIRTDANELLEQFCVTPFSYVLGYSGATVVRRDKPQWWLLPSCKNGIDKELHVSSGQAISEEQGPLDNNTDLLWNLQEPKNKLMYFPWRNVGWFRCSNIASRWTIVTHMTKGQITICCAEQLQMLRMPKTSDL